MEIADFSVKFVALNTNKNKINYEKIPIQIY